MASILFYFYLLPTQSSPKQFSRPSPACSPTLGHRLHSLLHRARVLLVGCCVISSSGGHLRPRRILSSIFFLVQFAARNKETTPPHTFQSAPAVSPLQCPSHRRCQLLVGCCVPPSNGGHLRPRVRPSLYFVVD
jgi:hypothetical protein